MKNLNGEKIELKKFFSGKNLVIIFLPKVGKSAKFLPDELKNLEGLTGCTNECRAYENEIDKFKNLGFEIVGISSLDTVQMREFSQSLNVSFELFSDDEFELEEILELETFKTLDGAKFYHRQTLVLKDGNVIKRFNKIAKPELDAKNLLAEIL